jgi:hypothetical protein
MVDYPKTKKISAEAGPGTRLKWGAFVLALISVALGAGGCEGYYSAYPGYYGPYGGGPYYGGQPYYAGYPGSVTVEVGDRAYYTRGPGYYVGRAYYVWRPGHWRWYHGQRVWVHGHYVLR